MNAENHILYAVIVAQLSERAILPTLFDTLADSKLPQKNHPHGFLQTVILYIKIY
jgi:hypothetical protein